MVQGPLYPPHALALVLHTDSEETQPCCLCVLVGYRWAGPISLLALVICPSRSSLSLTHWSAQ